MQTEFVERYITTGLKIAYYRKKAGYTQETFAEAIGKSLNFLAQVGTGAVRGVSLETLFKMADVLKIPPSRLLEDDRKQKSGPAVSVRFRSFSMLHFLRFSFKKSTHIGKTMV